MTEIGKIATAMEEVTEWDWCIFDKLTTLELNPRQISPSEAIRKSAGSFPTAFLPVIPGPGSGTSCGPWQRVWIP